MDNRRLTLLGRLAIVACFPYLTLKLLWVLGCDIGVLDTHRIGRATWITANVLTFFLDAVAAVVAHTLTRPAGLRTPAWLLAFPLWMASGLLIPLLTGLAGGSVTALVTGAPNPLSTDGFLAPWVFGVVYGGFTVEAITLLGAFGLYAHQRWGGLLRRPLDALPDTGTRALQRIFLLPAALLLAAAGAVHLLWGAGSTLGVGAAEVATRTVISSASEWAAGLLSLTGGAGLLLLVLPGLLPRLRVRTRCSWPGPAARRRSPVAAVCGWGRRWPTASPPAPPRSARGSRACSVRWSSAPGWAVLCAGSFALGEAHRRDPRHTRVRRPSPGPADGGHPGTLRISRIPAGYQGMRERG